MCFLYPGVFVLGEVNGGAALIYFCARILVDKLRSEAKAKKALGVLPSQGERSCLVDTALA